ncbi:MAG: RNA polymerase sigma factor [Fibrobacterota bacterium]
MKIEEIYKEYKDRVYSIAYRYLLNRDDAMDAAQETFLAINKRLASLEPKTAPSYILRTAVNKSIDIYRRNKKTLNEKTGILLNMTSKEDFKSSEYKDEVNFLLEKLSPDQRIAIIICDIIGYDIKSAADLLETEEGTVKSRLSRGKQKMRQISEKIREKENLL